MRNCCHLGLSVREIPNRDRVCSSFLFIFTFLVYSDHSLFRTWALKNETLSLINTAIICNLDYRFGHVNNSFKKKKKTKSLCMANLQGQWENIIKRRWFSMRMQIFSEFSFSGKWELRERERVFLFYGWVVFTRRSSAWFFLCTCIKIKSKNLVAVWLLVSEVDDNSLRLI